MIYVLSGGGNAKAYAVIGVTYPEGSVCTCTDGSKTLKLKDTSGQGFFLIPYAATWTVSATDGTNTKSHSVEITSEGQTVSVELSYQLVLFENGSLASGYSIGGSITIANGYLNISTAEDGVKQGYISPTIDVTNYSTMSFIAKQNPIPNSGHRIGLSKNSTETYFYNGYAVSASSIAQTDTKYSLDISALSGNYYFRMGMYSGSLYCSKVWFE